MNISKTIQELTNRLDEVHPYSASSSISNDQNRNDDGITYWKGKKIVSTKAWKDLYQKSSTYTDTCTTILTSRKPLQYFPDDYNGSISSIGVISSELREEVQNWNKDYHELLECRKNSTLGRMKSSKCLLSGSNDDPIFIGIEKVFARIVSNRCNNTVNTQSHETITYHCNVMNIFSCPFESKEESSNKKQIEESRYPYKREDLFALQRISFAIDHAISTFFELTKDNEIIYEIDFENDRVHEIHTKYNGEPESWGWHENVNEQLFKVKPISNIMIRNEEDIYTILTNKEKLNFLLKEYYEKYHIRLTESEEQQQQIILNEEKRHNIVSFILDNKDAIKIDDLKVNEPIYKCYRERGNCHICNSLSNILCKNCNENVWVCLNHMQNHAIEKH
jgi:hypothetical protein